MIDIHCHLLPGVDDGPKTWEETLAMVALGMEEGIESFVVTPHILDDLSAEKDRLLRAKFSELEERLDAKGLRVEVVLGAEIFYQFGLENIRDLEVATFGGNGCYFLLELPLTPFPPHLEQVSFRLQTMKLCPILAHAERYAGYSGNMKRLRELVRRGMLVQINSGSLTGRFGRRIRKMAHKLLTENLVHFVATDAHNTTTRPPLLRAAVDVVAELKGSEEVQRLFHVNPAKAIRGERIESEVYPFVEEHVASARSFWRKLIGQDG